MKCSVVSSIFPIDYSLCSSRCVTIEILNVDKIPFIHEVCGAMPIRLLSYAYTVNWFCNTLVPGMVLDGNPALTIEAQTSQTNAATLSNTLSVRIGTIYARGQESEMVKRHIGNDGKRIVAKREGMFILLIPTLFCYASYSPPPPPLPENTIVHSQTRKSH